MMPNFNSSQVFVLRVSVPRDNFSAAGAQFDTNMFTACRRAPRRVDVPPLAPTATGSEWAGGRRRAGLWPPLQQT